MPRRWYLLPCRTFQPVVVTTQSLPNGQQGTAYSFQFSANGGTTPYTWSLQSDTGSNTWTISSSGLLTGTPANAETDTITAKVTDAVGGVALSAPLSLQVTASGGSPYVFTLFIAPAPIGNDANNGQFPTQGQGNNGPWTLGSLANPQLQAVTLKQQQNNAAMAGKQVGVVGDQGVLSLANAGLIYPATFGATGNVLNLPSGTVTNQTVLASCNSSGQYVQGLAVLDGGISGSTINNGLTTTNVISSYNLLGRFSLTNNANDTVYITVDGLEVRNALVGGVVYGISSALGTTAPGWVIKNCFIHHVYNCNEGFTADNCSQVGTTVTIAGNLKGTVFANANPQGDQLFGITATGAAPANGGYNGKLIAQLTSTEPGGALAGRGTYQSSVSSNSTIPLLAGSLFAGNNTAGIHTHGANGALITNNFIQDVIDLNTCIPNNRRANGIKMWTNVGSEVSFNTIYATAATGFPMAGIEFKNVPQYNYVCKNNYINLVNAAPFTGTSVDAINGDGEGSSVTVPDGRFGTINNNLIVLNPVGISGYRTEEDRPLSALLVNWFNNTMIGATAGSHGGFQRFAPIGHPILTFHDNIIDRPNPPGGGVADVKNTVDGFLLIDYNLYPSNYLFITNPSGGGANTAYSAIPAQNGGIAGFTAALNAAGVGTTGLESNGGAGPEIGVPIYVNASGTKLKASDYKLASGSPGFQTGRVNGVSGGAVIDKGAWGGQTQVGCNFKDPSG